jgi:hypothetical protein
MDQSYQTSQTLLSSLESLLASSIAESGTEASFAAIEQKIAYLKSWYDGLQARSTYLTRCAEAQLRTVCTCGNFKTFNVHTSLQVYSMTSQRDSAINPEIARESSKVSEESKKIAELSREDNLAMREIAPTAAKDSATLRVIATVTLIFLPATFVAVSKYDP